MDREDYEWDRRWDESSADYGERKREEYLREEEREKRDWPHERTLDE